MAIVTPTDRCKSVRNRCVIEVFGGVFVLSRCFLDFSVSVGAFVIGLSRISTFFLFLKIQATALTSESPVRMIPPTLERKIKVEIPQAKQPSKCWSGGTLGGDNLQYDRLFEALESLEDLSEDEVVCHWLSFHGVDFMFCVIEFFISVLRL